MDQKAYPRKIQPEILKYIDKQDIIVLIGARQVGKTTLLQLTMNDLKQQGVAEECIYYFDLEDFSILEAFDQGYKDFISYLKALGANLNQRNYVFIDEIQYLKNPANLLKLIHDKYDNLKLIVSGSSTLEIREKFKDSLAGRKVVFEVYPLDFYEFLIFKEEEHLASVVLKNNIRCMTTDIKLEDLSAKYFSKDLTRHFNEYLLYGGYPRIVLEINYEKKVRYLTDLYTSYVKKDIKDIMRVDNLNAFNQLIRILSLQISGLVNIAELCNAVKIARETLERYLFLLENTFIIKTLSPFSSNPRKEISKMHKVFFMDTGLRNVIIKNFQKLDERPDAGALVENGVGVNILKNLSLLEELYFWRTLSKNEVDFVIYKGNRPKPVEVKYSSFKSPKIPPGIRYFAENYTTEVSIVLTKDFWGKNDRTLFLPIWAA